MSLCIAAACVCQSHGTYDPAIVMCFDARVEVEKFASAETEHKFLDLGHNWWAMLAGDVGRAHELLELYRSAIATGFPSWMSGDILGKLREPPRTMLRQMADAVCHNKAAISYDYYLREGSQQIHPDISREIAVAVANQQIGAELILVGLVNGEFRIYRFADNDVSECSDFAAIGSGRWLAEGWLYQREAERYENMRAILYAVYEAKRLGENVPGVGQRKTQLCVIRRVDDTNIWMSQLLGLKLEPLQELFQRIGPQPIGTPEYPKDFWEMLLGKGAC